MGESLQVKRSPTPAQIRARAARIVSQVVDHGRSLDSLLATSDDDAARGLTRSLVYGTLRWHIRLEAALTALSARAPNELDEELRALILVGLFQLLHTDIAVHAAVSETVEAATALKQKRAAGFVNAILRRCQREGVKLVAELDRDIAVKTAHPVWMVRQLEASWPQRFERILEANNEHPPMWLRVNRRRTDRATYIDRLRASGHEAEPHPFLPDAIRLLQAADVRKLPGFEEGDVSVQDASAQMAAHLLDVRPGDRVLDACAAPGGKACHIAEREPKLTELVALDVSGPRLRKVSENLARLGLQATILEGDASRPPEWWDGRHWQRILLDAPCSATGVIRRHPDIKLLRRPEDIAALSGRQFDLLEALWPQLAPGGRLVYATCSAFRAENAAVIERFLGVHSDATDVTSAVTSTAFGGLIPSSIAVGGGAEPGLAIPAGEAQMDGFYYACLDKGLSA